jgi:hypothetical protein
VVGGFSLPRGCAGLSSQGMGRGFTCACCIPVGSAGLHRQLWSWLAGRNSVLLFFRQTIPGTGFSVVGHREAFHRLGVQHVTEFNYGWCTLSYWNKIEYLLLIERKRKKRGRNGQGAFFPGHTCPVGCAMLGFYPLISAIKGCFKGQSFNFICA